MREARLRDLEGADPPGSCGHTMAVSSEPHPRAPATQGHWAPGPGQACPFSTQCPDDSRLSPFSYTTKRPLSTFLLVTTVWVSSTAQTDPTPILSLSVASSVVTLGKALSQHQP